MAMAAVSVDAVRLVAGRPCIARRSDVAAQRSLSLRAPLPCLSQSSPARRIARSSRRISRIAVRAAGESPPPTPSNRDSATSDDDVSIPSPPPLSTSASTPSNTSSGSSSSVPYVPLLGLSLVGAAETLYLSFEKLAGGQVACPINESCTDVLNSPYASLFGIPLPIFGFAAYSTVALLTHLSRPASSHTPLEASLLSSSSRWLLLSLTAAMATTSGYLMYILATELDGAFCLYCITSATLSTLLFALTVKSFSWRELQQALLPQLALVTATAVALSLSFADVRDTEIDLPALEPEVTTVSTPVRVQLAKHLSNVGAKLYGAFWCSHCYEQKQAFGAEASKYLPYVECYPEGFRAGVKLAKACQDVNIEGFPTWIIDGKVLPGEQDLDELARLTGFDGK
ncbi:hypothetical protein CLOM_g11811 [Closterium sp. NIES-68]|nr:hypothetical protein CLOM_g11811 [Closterium sp. NIES-68]GJP63765.1 hypothetical protein CLOP_g20811 [Closterium sp. NIES-67]